MDISEKERMVREYERMMHEWVEEAAPICDGFRSLFGDTTEGYLKFLFALNFMAVSECERRNIPTSQFLDAIPTIVGTWFTQGKPEGVELLCISGEFLEALAKRMREDGVDMGGRGSEGQG